MSTTLDERRAAYADGLRRIADLTEADVLPVSIIDVSFSWWFDERDNGRERAAVAAEALGVDWTSGRSASTEGPPALLTHATMRPAPLHLTLWLRLDGEPELERTPPPAAVQFAAELSAAARGEATR
jgi:hypothetical protein